MIWVYIPILFFFSFRVQLCIRCFGRHSDRHYPSFIFNIVMHQMFVASVEWVSWLSCLIESSPSLGVGLAMEAHIALIDTQDFTTPLRIS